jgi:4-hydroxybenzoate polyprenyltransferase/phosphoserine phosphatase
VSYQDFHVILSGKPYEYRLTSLKGNFGVVKNSSIFDCARYEAISKDAASNVQSTGHMAPLCVDLDGTLVHTNTLYETLLAVLGNIRTVLAIPAWLMAGKSRLKHELACRANLDPALLPYNEPLLMYLQEQKEAGRCLILCTAADRSLAEAVSSHLGLFDEVFASQESCNLRGAEKTRVLVERFGSRGFSYAGNDYTDLMVWREATSAVLVNTSPKLVRAATALVPIEHRIDGSQSRWRALTKALRPYQWVKNLLVFVPIVTANAINDLQGWLYALLLFLAFCLVASSIYLLNDLTDLPADRQHPRKKTRPFASGALPVAAGLALMPILFLTGVIFAFLSGAAPAVLLYAAVSVAYSLWLKELPLVDLFALASFYTLRLFAGGEATGHAVSLWLLAFSSFLFFSLAIVKRVSELMLRQQHETGTVARRGYARDDLQILQLMGVSASFVSGMILALYVQSPEIVVRYTYPGLLWLLVPLMLFWQCRIWLATTRGCMHDDPIVYAASDWVSRLVVACLAFVLVLASISL